MGKALLKRLAPLAATGKALLKRLALLAATLLLVSVLAFTAFSVIPDVNRGKQLAYLYTIARNLCVDYYRSPKREETMEGAAKGMVDKLSENPIEHVEKSLYLQMAVEKLPPEQQELILLRYVNGLSVREICKITGLSRSSEYRMEQEALRRLKRMLQEGGKC